MFDYNKLPFCDKETIKDVYLIKKNSASPTLVLFGKRYANEHVAAKVFTLLERNAVASVRPYLSTQNKNYLDFYVRAMQGLLYECQVYQLINKLLEKKVSPNFVKLHAVQKCDYNFIAALLNRPVGDILDTLDLKKVLGVNILKNFPVVIIITRRPRKSDDFSTFLSRKDIVHEDVIDVIFQTIYTLKVLTLNGISHQDLHLSNILVEELDDAVELNYIVDHETSFRLQTRFVVRIFDWDAAYVKSLGNNKFLSPKDCKMYGHCNVSNRKFDLFLFLCRLSMVCANNLGYKKLSTSLKEGVCDDFLLDVFRVPGTNSEKVYENIKKYWYNGKKDEGFYCFLRKHLPDAAMKDHLWILKSPYFDRLKIATSEVQKKDKNTNIYLLQKI